jgi:hypothetical protein
MGEGKEILKFDGGEEIKLWTECTYLCTKIDQLGDNISEIKHRISHKKSYKCFKFYLVAQKYYQQKKIIYVSNYNTEHFGLRYRSMANPYQINK